MRTSVMCLVAALIMRWLFDAATANGQTVDEFDVAMAADRLSPATLLYVRNPDMDKDAIELAPEAEAEPDYFLDRRPLELPAGVPQDAVPVRVFQRSIVGETEVWRFLGWLLMPLKDVQDLHAELVTM